MSEAGSTMTMDLVENKAKHLDDGIVKFPPNVQSLRVDHSAVSGYTQIIARQNDVSLVFVLDENDCRHLATLLTKNLRKP